MASQFSDPFSSPKAYGLNKGNAAIIDLPVVGQGTVAVRAKVRESLSIKVKRDATESLHLRIGLGNISISIQDKKGEHHLDWSNLKTVDDRASLLNPKRITTYWLSIDKVNRRLRYGKHFLNKSMTLLESDLNAAMNNRYTWLEHSTYVDNAVDEDAGEPEVGVEEQPAEPSIAVLPLPVTIDLSPYIISQDKVTLMELESGQFTVPSNLPEACQVLYGNVAGANITLNDKTFTKFSDAIERSCSNPDGWCYQKLVEKASHVKDPLKTYIRITIGYNQGNSPGVPYVLEIWPKDHYSSVHDHGNACAVIKVLCGQIDATYYDSLLDGHKIGIASLKKDDVTWLSPQNYQIHELRNSYSTVCCTIQCYRYDEENHVHHDKFDYIDDQGEVQEYSPTSDMAFYDFRQQMMAEWLKSGGQLVD
ncbi:RmlC-like cupin domain-containing protein [Lasiosphaeris hirsuta]|uniref:RmlC-like cupin domain-containing protein n=1 Tax=Lasiosphaeris hirsuta TaxID=260670 RepID=A0AA40A2D7_9PEZI|nr:RmlC-like cupin domain-containing protein [Lasiosphaeris hirsuta]